MIIGEIPTLEVNGVPEESIPHSQADPKMAAECSTAASLRENTLWRIWGKFEHVPKSAGDELVGGVAVVEISD